MHPEVVAKLVVACGLSFAYSHRPVPLKDINQNFPNAVAAQEAFSAVIVGPPDFIDVLNSWTRKERVAFLVNLFMVDEEHETSWELASRTRCLAADEFEELVERFWLEKTARASTEA